MRLRYTRRVPAGRGNNARLYKYERKPRAALTTDRIAHLKEEYEQGGGARSNLRYGYVPRPRA